MKSSTLADRLRKEIEKDPRSLYRLAKDAGMNYATLHRFATGERNEIRLRVASDLCEVLGLELVKRKGR